MFLVRLLGFASNETLGSVLAKNRGAGPGFDFLRVALAVLILVSHCGQIAGSVLYGADPTAIAITGDRFVPVDPPYQGGWDTWGRPFRVALVPMFFALSGFLVTGSAFRLKSVRVFLGFRVLRILPALLTEVTLSALVLGPIFTTLALEEYFRDPEFRLYFGNVIGWLHFNLPGVFSSHPIQTVNGNLWTLPAEFDCYAAAAVLMTVGFMFKRSLFTACVLLISSIGIMLNIFTDFGATQFHVDEVTLVYYFFLGSLFYHWKDRISLRPSYFVASAAIAFALLESRHGIYAAGFFLVYVVTWIGMVKIPKIPLMSRGDYSYGIYLYGYPILQALVAAFPQLMGHRWWVMWLGGALTCLFAAFSWHVIEKPSLRLKNMWSSKLTTSKTMPRPIEA